MNDITNEQLETVEIPDEKTGKMHAVDKDIEWYKKELAAMKKVVRAVTQAREMLTKDEEIKRRAWELYRKHLFSEFKNYNGERVFVTLKMCWEEAEKFNEFAKEIQEQ